MEKVLKLLELLNAWLEKVMTMLFPHDKCLHILAGAWLGLVCEAIWPVWWFMLACVLIVAVLRELYNRHDYGLFDWKDIAYTIYGTALIVVAMLIS